MSKRIIALFISLMAFLSVQFCYGAADIYSDNSPNQQTYAVFIPQGQKIGAVLSDGLNSNNAIMGQVVQVYLLEDFKYGSTTVAKAGSAVIGSIVKNKKAKNDAPAYLTVRFTSIRTPYNNKIPISALISTPDGTGTLKGTTKNPNVIIPSDTKVTILFDQPITLIAQ